MWRFYDLVSQGVTKLDIQRLKTEPYCSTKEYKVSKAGKHETNDPY